MVSGTTGKSGVKRRARGPAPWSVRGVSQEARAKTAKAAQRRGETMGEWVTNALIQAADAELGSDPQPLEQNGGQPPAPSPAVETKPAVSTSPGGIESEALLSALERRLAQLRRSERAVADDGMSEPELEAMARALLALAQRGERSARHERLVRSLLEVLIARVEHDRRRGTSIDGRLKSVLPPEPQQPERIDSGPRDAGGGQTSHREPPETGPVPVARPSPDAAPARGETDAPHGEPASPGREAPPERDRASGPATPATLDRDPFLFAYDRLHQRAMENTERRVEKARRRRGLGFLGLRTRRD